MRIDVLTKNTTKLFERLKTSSIASDYNVVVHEEHDELTCPKERSVLFAVEYGRKIPDYLIKYYGAKGGAVFTLHRADPRRYKGASVINHQILNGKTKITPTVMRLRPGEALDCGEIMTQLDVEIYGLSYPEIVDKLRKTYPLLMIRALMASNQTAGKDGAGRRSPEDSEITDTSSIRKILAADPVDYPAYFVHHGRRFEISITPIDPPGAQKLP